MRRDIGVRQPVQQLPHSNVAARRIAQSILIAHLHRLVESHKNRFRATRAAKRVRLAHKAVAQVKILPSSGSGIPSATSGTPLSRWILLVHFSPVRLLERQGRRLLSSARDRPYFQSERCHPQDRPGKKPMKPVFVLSELQNEPDGHGSVKCRSSTELDLFSV